MCLYVEEREREREREHIHISYIVQGPIAIFWYVSSRKHKRWTLLFHSNVDICVTQCAFKQYTIHVNICSSICRRNKMEVAIGIKKHCQAHYAVAPPKGSMRIIDVDAESRGRTS